MRTQSYLPFINTSIILAALLSSCLTTNKPDTIPPTGAVTPVLESPTDTQEGLSTAGDQLTTTKEDVSKTKAMLEEYGKRLAAAEEKLSATKAEIISVEARLKTSNQQLKDGVQGQKQVNATITEDTSTIRKQDKSGTHTIQVDSIEEAVAHSDTIVTGFEKISGELTQSKTELMAVTAELEQAKADMNKAGSDLTASTDKLTKVEQQLSETKDDLQDTRARVVSLTNADTEKAGIIDRLNNDKKELGKIISQKDAEIAKAQSTARSLLNKLLITLVGIGVALVGLAVYLGISAPNPKVLAIAGLGLALSIVSLMLMFYMDKIILVGFIAVITIVVFMVVQAYIHYKDRQDKNKYKTGLEEVVETTEVAKTKLKPDDVNWLFGDHHTNGQAGIIQNKDTMALVHEVRVQLENRNKSVTKKTPVTPVPAKAVV